VIISAKDALVFALIPELKIKKKKTPRPNNTMSVVNTPWTTRNLKSWRLVVGE
jgi:hypothetical protein